MLPELPEVEVIRRDLLPLKGRRIETVEATDPDLFESPLTPDGAEDKFTGQKLLDIKRYGKYLAFQIAGGWLIFHPRMSGKVQFRDSPPGGADRSKLIFKFEGLTERRLYFTSLRRFTRFYWQSKQDLLAFEKFKGMGPDPFWPNYTWQNFKHGLLNRRSAVKTLLMNQKFIAGVGNIYASEACFRAGVDPRKKIPEIRRRTLKKLYRIIPKLLREAVAARGSSLEPATSATAYLDASSRPGRFKFYHRVYGREGEYCVDCGGRVKKIKQAGRSTYFCSSCQQ